MIALRPGAEQNAMVEVKYSQKREGTMLETLVQDVHLCASMEFLLTVAAIFRNAMEQGFQQAAPQPRSTSGAKSANTSVQSKEPRESRPPLTDSRRIHLFTNAFIFVFDLLRCSSCRGVKDGDEHSGPKPRDRVCGRPDAGRRSGPGHDHTV